MNILDSKKLDYAIDFILKRIDENIVTFEGEFPNSDSRNYVYTGHINYEWTPGFWTGMIWLAYQLTGDEKYRKAAEAQLDSYYERLVNKVCIDTHDIGFIYSLSCVAAYKITGNEKAKQTAVMAADHLITRFHEKGKFIQAWGQMGEEGNRRLIIDCLLNIPFLFWASDVTGDGKYRYVAQNHLKTALSVITRPDYTTHHTFFFSPETGEPLYGRTVQGYSDDSCWARGQSWGVSGTALNYKYVKEDYVVDMHKKITDTFMAKLPEDNVPYWDMDFGPEDNEPRDTSAAAIAACGILEMSKFHPNEAHLKCVSDMLNALIDNFLTEKIPNANGILSDGMYNRNDGSNPESTLWGDYFFFEALARIKKPDIELYW
ncbi:MAG: glucoronyl hydrolase [Ruminococcaceae bacterium]|nr:glucoronyl hydrolase [Oscillospiraceae bacterium]